MDGAALGLAHIDREAHIDGEEPDGRDARALAAAAIAEPDAATKSRIARAAFLAHLRQGAPRAGAGAPASPPPSAPVAVPERGVPERPELVPPKRIPKPGAVDGVPLNVHLLHQVTHIEYNAVNLALDTGLRFGSLVRTSLPGEPGPDPDGERDGRGAAFERDFFRVAADEARHLSWCLARLAQLGYEYGCLPSHNLLWDGCSSTSSDVVDRLVVVPCVQEARGLDAGPRLVERLVGCGDAESARVVEQITGTCAARRGRTTSVRRRPLRVQHAHRRRFRSHPHRGGARARRRGNHVVEADGARGRADVLVRAAERERPTRVRRRGEQALPGYLQGQGQAEPRRAVTGGARARLVRRPRPGAGAEIA